MGMIFGGWGGGVILFVVLICALAAEASEGKRKLLGAFLDNGNRCSPSQNDQDTVKMTIVVLHSWFLQFSLSCVCFFNGNMVFSCYQAKL